MLTGYLVTTLTTQSGNSVPSNIVAERHDHGTSTTGVIAGATVGGVVGLLLIGAVTFCFLKQRKNKEKSDVVGNANQTMSAENPHQGEISELDETQISQLAGQKDFSPAEQAELDAERPRAELAG